MTVKKSNLNYLVPSRLDQTVDVWATVTQASPLRIRLDGETTSLPYTPDTLVGPLAVADRVWVAFAINADPSFHGRRAIVIGTVGGVASFLADFEARLAALEASDLDDRVTVLESGPNSKTHVSANAQTTGSTSFVDVTGATMSFTKRLASTKLLVTEHAQFVTPSTGRGAEFGVRIDNAGTDHLVAPMHQTVAAANARLHVSGAYEISGVAAGVREIDARWRAVAGTGDLVRNVGDDFISFTVTEVTG